MFKTLGTFIHKTPWWALVSGGLGVVLGLVLFAVPIQVIRLHDTGATPQEKRAIEREISMAFGGTALNFAEEVVRAMRARATDPDRQVDLSRALAEIARAKQDLLAAQSDASKAVRESAKDSADAAMVVAQDAAQAALDAAVEAREAVEEARDDAIALLRDRGLDPSATERSFDGMLKTASDNEKAAREALESITAILKNPPFDPGTSKRSRAVVIDIPAQAGLPVLPEGLRGEIRDKVDSGIWRIGVGSALILAFIPLFVVLLIAKYFLGRSRRALAVAEEKTQEAQLSHMSRQVTEARLQALQAQVEPHFLYNTLANVQALTEVDAAAANRMVGHLIAYLRAALPKMRENTSTVGQELELVRAYLNILQMRMGQRLQFSISAPPDVLRNSFPPMMLPSLVENAIKHGLEPLREGGRIDVVVERETTPAGDRIRMQVRDTGRGLSDAPVRAGGGVGLSNVRERLAAIYAGNARFSIESNAPRGVLATIDVPTEVPTAEP
ncbi:MAG: histidine kinase, partial [Rhodoferax sp.]|nr:histidine kinase [Rhodoferax sp.]